VPFNVSDAGVSKAITNWGIDTGWSDPNNMQRGLIWMGTNNVTIVRMGFYIDTPLTNGATIWTSDVSTNDKALMQTETNIAAMATAATRWDIIPNSSIHSWYSNGVNRIYPDRWAAAISACQKYYNHSIWAVEGFNEPDNLGAGEGSQQDLYNVFTNLQGLTNFSGALMEGGSALNTDVAISWFQPLCPRVAIGSTHCLAGSAQHYIDFINTVTASNCIPFNPEMHNVGEAILGVNYGLQGGIWWGSAERTRGEFVKACQGRRLGYADDLTKYTVAAVYRSPSNSVQAFVAGTERTSDTTTYQFFAKDRDVFYDGNGPQRAYSVTFPGSPNYGGSSGLERVVNVTWGADVQPAIAGRYIIVNHNSGKVLEVPGSSTNNGVVLDQTTYTGAANQQWEVYSLPNNFGGDASYYTIINASSGVTADVQGWSYANGAVIQQWNGGTNIFENWILQYTTNGWFKIRTRYCNKVMGVNGASTANGATIQQWDDTGTLDHEWRLIPATVASYEFIAPDAPTLVTATANAVSVQLNWKTNSEADLASYTVLRSTTNGGPYDIVARGLTTNSFTDKSANLAQNYYYVVKAVDKSLNTSANSSQVVAQPTANRTLIAKYSFDGNVGDSSGNANHPIVTNGTPSYVAGKFGSALTFDGSSQSLLLPANLLAGVTNFTFGAWVYWNGGNAWQRIFDFGNDTTSYMFLSPSSGNSTLRFSTTTNGGWWEQWVETSPLASNQWVHVAVTRNGTTAKLYTNGVLAAQNTVNIPPANFNPALNYLGKSQFPADPLFNGRLDEVYLYNYALSDAEIARLTNNVPPPPNVPTTLAATFAGNHLNFSWPSNYLGCRLESNSISLIATNAWFTVGGSASTNQATIPVNPLRSNVFFRLNYP